MLDQFVIQSQRNVLVKVTDDSVTSEIIIFNEPHGYIMFYIYQDRNLIFNEKFIFIL